MSTTQFGSMLRNARKRAGMTQSQLAEISTVSIRAIRDLELERTGSPRVQTVRLLADALRLDGVRRAELEAVAGPREVRSLYDDLPAPPATLASSIARAEETASLIGLLRSTGHQLVRVTGAPGMGKTTLLQNVAGELHRTGLVPVVFLDRAGGAPGSGHGVPRRLVSRVAEVIGCGAGLDDVAGRLAADDVLLVVDGRDLDDRDQRDLRALVRLCRGLRVLIESRDLAAGRAGEITFTLFPLDVPEWDRPAAGAALAADSPVLRYVLSHCALLYPEKASSPETVAAVAGVCWLLDGIPAALESAVSWLLIYEPVELLRMAQASPAKLVTPPSGNGSPLVAWLRQALASLPSFQLAALRGLAGSGPWSVSDAVALLAGSGADAASAVHDLRARGLVRRVKSAPGEAQRFVVLNLIRHLLRGESGPQPPSYGVPLSWSPLRDVQPLTS
ncbi:helix-turn-helix domain-containing protein [Streptomyces seoulensis]